jgi:GT2 family glycosyltransferase
MINICILAYNRYDCLKNLIVSILDGCLLPDRIIVLDNGNSLTPDFFKEFKPIIDFVLPGKNLGIAQGWNWFLRNVPEKRIILNDDLVFHKDTLEKFMEGYSETSITRCGGILLDNAFSFFAIPDFIVNKVGEFDKNFWPGYFEDNDYVYRMSLLGYGTVVAKDSNADHVGSAHLKVFTSSEMDNHHKNFRANRAYYVQKWGGLPGEEKFITPFNK